MRKNRARLIPCIVNEDEPLARLRALGVRSLLDAELFDIIAGSRSQALLDEGGVSLLADEMDLRVWLNVFSKSDAPRFLCLSEAVRRKRERAINMGENLDSPAKVYERLLPLTHGLAVEKCWVIPLNRRNKALCTMSAVEISVGSATSALLHPREVLKACLKYSAAAFIIAHNHPSGDPAPSHADRSITKGMVEAGRTIGIECLDHVVIGRADSDPLKKGFFSFGENGLI